MRLVKYRSWLIKKQEMIYDFTIIHHPYKPNSDNILMQYVGMNDKNGCEIYEGDILKKDSHWSWYVGYDNGSFVSIPTNRIQRINQKEKLVISHFNMNEWEIVGNIHENKHLIEN